MINWYTADPHFGHENVIKFNNRPFRSGSHMDAVMMQNLWAMVGPKDVLWIIGDFAHGPKAKDTDWLTKLFDKLPGAEKHLIVGNHDLEPTKILPWTSVSHLAEVRDGPQKQAHTLCHYPMITWNHARRDALQIFGHVHNNWKGSRNSVNAGVDVWDYMPVRFEDIARRAKTLPVNKHWADVEHNVKEI